MLKAIITIVLAFALYWVGKTVYLQSRSKVAQDQKAEKQAKENIDDQGLPRLAPNVESALAEARTQGAPGLKRWLDSYGRTISDPNLAAVQLDYAVQLARQDPAAAQSLFRAVKTRTPANSPLQPRIKKLEATFGP